MAKLRIPATLWRTITIICSLALLAKSQSSKYPAGVSPCPRVFEYEPPGSEEDRWYGVMKLNSDVDLHGIWINILLDKKADVLGNWFGDVTSKDNTEFIIENKKEVLRAGTTKSVRFFVKSGLSIPRVKWLRLNGRQICTADNGNTAQLNYQSVNRISEQPTIDKKGPYTEEDYFLGDLHPASSVKSKNEECGKVETPSISLITSGTATSEGQYPWHVAIYRMKYVDSTYICGGNLVSKEYVITAAHCVTRASTKRPINQNILTLHLGKYNLRLSVKGVQLKFVSQIITHPDYATSNVGNDIAILKLRSPVDITDHVRPVCLWPDDLVDLSNVVDKTGAVVGWGFDENGRITEDLRLAQMPVIDEVKCLRSYGEFYSKYTTSTTFCAGYLNGTSVCNGDSGGGMVFPLGTTTDPTWHLRGLVSVSAALRNQGRCDPSHYVIFTDVAKFNVWIKSVIQSLK